MEEQVINLVGLEVKSVRGNANGRLQYILFSDMETFIEFEDQDEFTYHDASPDAFEFCLSKDKSVWDAVSQSVQIFPEIEVNGWVTDEKGE